MIQIVVEIMSVIMMVPGQPGNVLTSAPASAVRTIVMATLPVIMVHVQMGIAAIQKNIAVIAAMGIQQWMDIVQMGVAGLLHQIVMI